MESSFSVVAYILCATLLQTLTSIEETRTFLRSLYLAPQQIQTVLETLHCKMAQEIERQREETINFAAGPAQLPYEVRW